MLRHIAVTCLIAAAAPGCTTDHKAADADVAADADSVAPDTGPDSVEPDTVEPDTFEPDTADTAPDSADTEPETADTADTADTAAPLQHHVLCDGAATVTVDADDVDARLAAGAVRGPCSPFSATLVPASDTVIDCDGRELVAAADGPEVFLLLDDVERVQLTRCTVSADFGVYIFRGGHHEIRANTFTVGGEAVSIIDASDNVVADNTVRFGGLGVRIERDSDRNVYSGNDSAPAEIEPATERPGMPEPRGNPGAASVLIFDEPLPEFGVINAIVAGRLLQSPAGEGRPDDNVVRDNDIVAGDPVGIAVMTRSNRTLVEHNRVQGGAAFGIASFGFPEVSQVLVPGACSGDATRLCRDDADCDLAGFDAAPLGACVGAAPMDVDGRVREGDFHDNDVAAAGFAGIDAYLTVDAVIRDNTVLDSPVGILLEGPSVAAITVTGNTVSGNATGLKLNGEHGVPYGANVSGNDFVDNEVGVEAVNVRAAVDGNYWGHEGCPGFLDADRVGPAADCAAISGSIADAIGDPVACPLDTRPHALDGVCAFDAPSDVAAGDGHDTSFEVALDYAGTYQVTPSGLAIGVSTSGALVAGDGTWTHPLAIPPGMAHLRLHLEPAPEDLGKGHDLDLVLFDGDCEQVDFDNCPFVAPFTGSSDELIDIAAPSEAGYVIGVDPYYIDGEDAHFRVTSYIVPPDDGLLTVTAPAVAAPGTTATVTVAWPATLTPGSYLASLHHTSAEADLGTTLLALEVAGAGPSLRVGTGANPEAAEWATLTDELAHFTAVTGLSAEIVHVDDSDALLAAPGEPPVDVMFSAQPASVRAYDALGYVKRLAFSPGSVAAAYGPGGLALVTNDAGDVLALPAGAAVKSLVWARKDTFVAPATPPATWEALVALTAQLAADEGPPWAMPLGDYDPYWTHWPATDWIEDLVLKSCGPFVYDGIFAGERPFSDPCMKTAFERFGAIAREDSYLAGGALERERIFSDVGGLARPVALNDYIAGNVPDYPFVGAPAPARLTHQASFFAYIVSPGGGYWNYSNAGFIDQMTVFPTPAPAGSQYADAAVVAGDLLMRVSSQPSGVAYMAYLMSDDYGTGLAAHGVIVPNVSFDAYPADQSFVAAQAQVYRAAMISGQGRFDGSDLLPGPVEKAFRDALVAYLAAATPDLDALLASIDAAWTP